MTLERYWVMAKEDDPTHKPLRRSGEAWFEGSEFRARVMEEWNKIPRYPGIWILKGESIRYRS